MNPIIETLLNETLDEIRRQRRLPETTYRLQFHAGFTFNDALRIVPYLHELGVTHCYASPYLKARAGSTHGYDIIDHRVLNPQIGTEEEYTTWTNALAAHGMGQVLDMVPNHMGIMGNENPWWRDVLENGPSSPFGNYFDISWFSSPRPELHGKVLLPVLGDPYGKVLESQQLKLEYDAGAFTITYYALRVPVAPRSYGLILSHTLADLLGKLPPDAPALIEFQSILTAVKHLPGRNETDPAKLAERFREKEVVKRRLAALTEQSVEVRESIARTVTLFNGNPKDPASFNLLDQLLDDQAYRLAYWRVASDEINYRRFFDINELAALSMEREDVYAATHVLVLRLLLEGKLDGLRIDHPDGLYDPKQYLQRLQQSYIVGRARQVFSSRPQYQGLEWNAIERLLREQIDRVVLQGEGGPTRWPLYVVVEKILATGEQLPAGWPTFGTTGYEFLNMVGGLFVETDNAKALTEIYMDWTLDDRTFDEVAQQCKFLILQSSLSSELHMLAYQLDRLAQLDRWSRDFTVNGLRHALRLVISFFPVYRSYIADEGISDTDRKHILRATYRARQRDPSISAALFDFIRDALLQKSPRPVAADDAYRLEQRRFAGKFQQVTAPVMAKGVEDTSFYIYNRLLSLNEVGGEPSRFGLSAAALHRYFQDRQAKWPYALSSSSTHDTKRSEDVRARLNVLSEIPDECASRILRWAQLNRAHYVEVEDLKAPDVHEDYLLYQTLVGAWPLEPYTEDEYAAFVERVQNFMQKAIHEAKAHTSWIHPNPEYDEAIRTFVGRVLDPAKNAAFIDDVRELHRQVSHHGLFNSLSQAILKLAAPGVPDTYQGTELWDFSLTDPDNRRPVDYDRRQQLLAELKARVEQGGADLRPLAAELVRSRIDGRIKLYLTWRTLTLRRDHPGLFSAGEYIPVETAGKRADHAFAFLRRAGDVTVLVVVPRFFARLVPSIDTLPLGAEVWDDTAVVLPDVPAGRARNRFTGAEVALAAGARLPLAELLGDFPVGLLVAD
jgi:(1->4)-alpha-D-glucan 1-alpha-D-glucosylmutase